MPAQIELYEEMSALSSRMVAAARAGEWDSLIELERKVTGLRDILMTTPDDGSATTADLARKTCLIQSILRDDAEVRRHTEPWMEHMRRYLGENSRRRDVNKAYAAGAGEFPAGRPIP